MFFLRNDHPHRAPQHFRQGRPVSRTRLGSWPSDESEFRDGISLIGSRYVDTSCIYIYITYMYIYIIYIHIYIYNHIHAVKWWNYMVSGSQNAACFSNGREFILHVFSQGFVSRSFFDSVKSCDKLLLFLNFFASDFQVFVSHTFQDLSQISIDIMWTRGRYLKKRRA